MTLTQNQNIEVATEKVETLLGSWDISLMFIYCGTNRVAYTLFVPQCMKCFKWHDYNRGTLLYNRGSTNFDKNLVYFFWKKCEDDIENWTSTIGKLYIYIDFLRQPKREMLREYHICPKCSLNPSGSYIFNWNWWSIWNFIWTTIGRTAWLSMRLILALGPIWFINSWVHLCWISINRLD